MARLFETGLETGDTSDFTSTVGTATAQTSVVRSGTYALQLEGGTAAQHSAIKSGITNAAFYRADVFGRYAAVPAAGRLAVIVQNTSAQNVASVLVNTAGALTAQLIHDDGGFTNVAGSTVIAGVAAFHKITLKATKSVSSDGSLLVYVNDVLEATVSAIDNDTRWGTGAMRFLLANGGDTAGELTYYDDIVVQDVDADPYAAHSKTAWRRLFSKVGGGLVQTHSFSRRGNLYVPAAA